MSDPQWFAGQTLPADQLQDLGEYGVWTPTLSAVTTPPTLGTAAVTSGVYHRNGRLITLTLDITFGSAGTAAGSGVYIVGGLPFSIDTLGAGMSLGGSVFILDGTNRYVTIPRVQSSTTFTLMRTNITATENVTEVTNALPFAWGTGDSIRGTVTYIGDP